MTNDERELLEACDGDVGLAEAILDMEKKGQEPDFATLSRIDKVRWVYDHKSARVVDGVLVDMMTANAIITVYDALSQQENKDKLAAMSIVRMAEVAWKLVK